MALYIGSKHPLIINRDKGLVSIWDDEKQDYQIVTPELIEDLAEMVKNTHESKDYVTVINTYV